MADREAFAFLSGPIETLRKARTARVVDLELDDGTTLPATNAGGQSLRRGSGGDRPEAAAA